MRCADCGSPISPQAHQALSGEVQSAWTGTDGSWICITTGDEHRPEGQPEPITGDDLATAIEDLRADLQDTIEDLRQQIDDLRDTVSDLRDRIE